MKNLSFIIVLGVVFLSCGMLAMPLHAQDAGQAVKTDISSVRVYLQGAEVIRNQQLNLAKGRHRLVFTGLSPQLVGQSIQVTASENTSILSITSKTNFLSPRKTSPRAQAIRDSLELMQMEQQDLADLEYAFQKEEQILKANQQLKGQDQGLSTDELIKVANFYRSRFREIFSERTKIKRQKNAIRTQINRLNGQLSQLNAGNQPTSEVYLEIKVKSPTTTSVKLRYVVSNAGWSPIYDLKAGTLNEPIELKYRALAYNGTGIDWENVKITLSTADPYQSASKPLLSPWYLNEYAIANNSQFQRQQGRLNSQPQVLNNMTFDNDVNVPTAPSSVSGGRGIRLEEIEINELSNDFEIDDPYTIPSDSKPYSIDIKTHQLNASYRHYAVPKLDKDAFLLAQVTGWEQLDLIDGPMHIYHGETYIGQANLSTRTLNDTLDLSLGRDKNVIVTRIKQKEQNKKQFFGSDRKVTRSYKITVKNNHLQPITIEIQDQIPVSNDKEIEVNLIERSKADYAETTGKLIWRFKDIPSGGKRSAEFAYSIKHPKSKPVQLEKKRKTYVPRY